MQKNNIILLIHCLILIYTFFWSQCCWQPTFWSCHSIFFLVLSTEKTKRVNLSFNIVGWNLFSVILVEIYNPCDFTKIYTIYNTTQALSYIPQNSKIYIFCNPLPPQLKVLWYISNCKKLHCQAYTWEVEQCLN